MPERIQRKRSRGWRMPENTVVVTRGTKHGNPFRVGGWFKVGRGRGFPGMAWCEALDERYAAGFTKIKTAAQAVEFYKLYVERYKIDLSELRGKNLACWCAVGEPCHADFQLEVANG